MKVTCAPRSPLACSPKKVVAVDGLVAKYKGKLTELLAAIQNKYGETAAAPPSPPPAAEACMEGWAGAACDECAPGYSGDMCDEKGDKAAAAAAPTPPATPGCMEGWAGEDCDECAAGYSGDMCDEKSDEAAASDEGGGDSPSGECLVGKQDGCSAKQKKYIAKMQVADAAKLGAQIARLTKMEDEPMTEELERWLQQRLAILKQLSGEVSPDGCMKGWAGEDCDECALGWSGDRCDVQARPFSQLEENDFFTAS